MTRSRFQVLDYEVDDYRVDEVVDLCTEVLDAKEKLLLTTANAYSLQHAGKDASFHEHFQHADVVLPDGILIVWFSRLMGNCPIPRKITGLMFFEAFVEVAVQRGYRVAFVGSTNEVLDRIQANLLERYPGLQLSAMISPPFGGISDEENDRLIEEINASDTDVLLVGMTAPRQEKWLSRNFDRLTPNIQIGIGAAFDYLAGTKPRPPDWLAHMGFEWAFRLYNEPRRLLGRNVGNFRFLGQVIERHWREIGRGVVSGRFLRN